MATYDLGLVVGADGQQGPAGADGADGNGIASIELLSTSGLVKTYRITFDDGDYFDYQVTDGSDASVTIQTSWGSTLSDTKVPSEKLTKNTIDGLDIPTKISDLTNDSDFIETSSTTGLIKNDGSIMTSGTGSTNYSAGNHTHSGYVSATKVTSWSSTTSDSNVPSEKLVKDTIDALEDLIGDAIDYINL